jgi:hypothetical protein
MSALATAVSFKSSACVPLALGSVRLATGYLSMRPQELVRFQARD